MPFFQLPRLNQPVFWKCKNPSTVLRFGPGGGLVLLHATDDPAMTAKDWQTLPLELGLFGVSLDSEPTGLPLVLCAKLGNLPTMAAPACILEIGNDLDITEWLKARPALPDLRLVLVRRSNARPGEAIVEASRRIWAGQWGTGEVLIREHLQEQFLTTAVEETTQVYQLGRQVVADTPAELLLKRSAYKLAVDKQSGQSPFMAAADQLTTPSFN